MERRSLLKFSAIGALLLSAADSLKAEPLPYFDGVHIPSSLPPSGGPLLDRLNSAFAQPGVMLQSWRLGWQLLWTGWKGAQDTTTLTAQWVAYPISGDTYFYSSTPGIACSFYRGYVFDVCPRPDQTFLYLDDLVLPESTLLDRAARSKLNSYADLLKVMREHGHKV